MSSSSKSQIYYFEQLFGSKTRVKLLRLFLVSSDTLHYYLREICRTTGEHLNSVRRELDNLEKLGLIEKDSSNLSAQVKANAGKIFYKVNKDFVLFNEIKALFLKSQLLLEKTLIKKIGDIGSVQLLVLTGAFTANEAADTDLLIVGRIKAAKLAALIKQFEKELGRDINYTIMSTGEFNYRRELTDMFLYNILENKKVVLIDKLSLDKEEKRKDYSRRKINVKKGNS